MLFSQQFAKSWVNNDRKKYCTLLLNTTNSSCTYTRHQIDYMTQYNIGQW